MSAPQINIPEQYTLESVTLTAERFSEDIDITGSIEELNIFESLDSIFLSGNLLFLDDNGLLSAIDLSGTERITMTLSLPAEGSEKLTKTFIISSVKDQIKTNNNTVIVKLQLIEEIGFLAQVKKYSKAYSGTAEQILAKICKDQLNMNLVNLGKNSVQESFKVLVPYLTVEQSLKWVLSKATTVNGSPFFLFSTLKGNKLYLLDLDTILQNPSANPDFPFIFSSSFTNMSTNSIKDRAREIQSIKLSNQDDTINLARRGSIGASFTNTLLDANRTNAYHHDIVNVYSDLVRDGIVEGTQKKGIVDYNFKLSEIPLNNYNSNRFYQLSFSTFEDIKNYYEEQDFSVTKNRIKSKSLLNLLQKQPIEINVPGALFLTNTYVGPGTNISVVIENNSTTNRKETDVQDKTLSGVYIIYNKRHLFSGNGTSQSHKVSLKLCRIAKEL